MAKEIPIIIKVNGKELDVAKTSVNDFNKAYSDAAAKLNSLPLGSDEWKKLNTELKNADKTFNQTKDALNETEGKFKSLRLQIRQTTIAFQEAEEKGDVKSMKKLKGDLDDLNDQLEVTTLKSMKFVDALATLPGVAGFVGQSLQGIDKAFKILVANPILALVSGLVAAFTFLKEALGKTKEGQAALNKVSQAFSSVMGPLLALINKVAVPIFEKLADIINMVGEAFSWFAQKMGISSEEIATATKDIDKVGQEAAEKEKERNEKLQQQREKDAQDRKERLAKQKQEAEEKKKLTQDNINDNAALAKSEQELANAKKKASEDPIQAMKDEQVQKDKDFEDDKKRINDLMKVKGTTTAEQKKLQTELNNKEAAYLSDKAKRTQDIIKQEQDIVDKKKEANDLIIEGAIKAIKDETIRATTERQKQYTDEKVKFDKLLADKLISKTQYDTAIKNAETTLANDLEKIQDDAEKKENEKKLKKLDDDLKFLQIKAESTKQGTIAYYDIQREIQSKAQERELEDLQMSDDFKALKKEEQEARLLAIKDKYLKMSKDLNTQEILAYADMASKIVGIGTQITGALGAIYENQMNKELKDAADNQAKQEEIKKKYFEKNKKLQIANASIQMFQSAISAYSSMAAIPVVGPALGVIAAAAAIALGVANINKIKSQQYESAAGAGGAEAAKPAQANYGQNYGDGGMIDGPRHAGGGVMINAEGGEAVMTRGAVTMFAPLLSALNVAGGGTSFSKGAIGQANSDVPKSGGTTVEPQIIKTYVVSSDLTTEAQKQARLKDLSTL
jgi:hypothetical protein